MKQRVICVIMGGGRGTRLHPLTKLRCKPAVPLAGKYRLVDIPISNCLNSGYNQIFVLTQFNTASLHRHLQESYKFDPFNGGSVDILSAEQTERGENWYQGTADAVRQNLMHFHHNDNDIFLILSGDQLYRMDFRDIVQRHVESGADVTIAGTPVERSLVSDFGLMRLNGEGWIEEFVEKPTDAGVIDNLVLSGSLREAIENPGDRQFCLANMGIYCFTAKTLRKALDNDKDDFGKEIIPGMLKQGKLLSYVYNGYWEDIGTIKAFFDANLRLTDDVPPFNFFDSMNPVFTRARYLAASKINACKMSRVILSDGCILSNTEFSHCVIGVRSVVRRGTSVRDSILMGADLFETNEDRQENRSLGRPDVGIGENCEIEYAIIDKNVRIGNNVRLSPRGKPDMWEAKGIMVRDGVLIVTKNSIIPDGTVVWDEAESKA